MTSGPYASWGLTAAGSRWDLTSSAITWCTGGRRGHRAREQAGRASACPRRPRQRVGTLQPGGTEEPGRLSITRLSEHRWLRRGSDGQREGGGSSGLGGDTTARCAVGVARPLLPCVACVAPPRPRCRGTQQGTEQPWAGWPQSPLGENDRPSRADSDARPARLPAAPLSWNLSSPFQNQACQTGRSDSRSLPRLVFNCIQLQVIPIGVHSGGFPSVSGKRRR